VTGSTTVAEALSAGLKHHQAGRLSDAGSLYRQVLEVDPANADALHLLGVIARQTGHSDVAVQMIGQAISLNPRAAHFHGNLGIALAELGRFDDAARSYEDALRLRPDDPALLNDLGNALRQAGRYEEAVARYRAALRVRPDAAEVHNNLGITLRQFGRFDEAVACCREALTRMPHAPEAHNNLGLTLMDLGRLAEAEACCRQALRLRPDYAGAHANLGAILLLAGRLPEGWAEYEWRWKAAKDLVARPFAQPQWTGGAPGGRVLLVHAEQGFGDTLQFCRYVPRLASEARVVLEVPQALLRLLSGLGGLEKIVAQGEPLPPFDLHCPMLSLPYAFATTLDDIPDRVPYLSADAAQAAGWRQRLAGLPGVRVGVAWTGNPRPFQPAANAIDRRRSIPFERFARLLDMPEISFVSLQKRETADGQPGLPPGVALHDWTDELGDFADTAALIEALDLVVTVDTSVVHLAGALGKPVWLLNRFDTCWRWLLDRTDSPWYPTLRQFRQPTPGDWDAVLAAVRAALARLARDTCRPA
jgi:Flp pilus assembly protein TadD